MGGDRPGGVGRAHRLWVTSRSSGCTVPGRRCPAPQQGLPGVHLHWLPFTRSQEALLVPGQVTGTRAPGLRRDVPSRVCGVPRRPGTPTARTQTDAISPRGARCWLSGGFTPGNLLPEPGIKFAQKARPRACSVDASHGICRGCHQPREPDESRTRRHAHDLPDRSGPGSWCCPGRREALPWPSWLLSPE